MKPASHFMTQVGIAFENGQIYIEIPLYDARQIAILPMDFATLEKENPETSFPFGIRENLASRTL